MRPVSATIGLADAATNHHDQAAACGGDRDQARERDQEAETRRRIGGLQALFGIVIEGVAHRDDGGKANLRFRVEGVDIMLVFAADRAFAWRVSAPPRSDRQSPTASCRAPPSTLAGVAGFLRSSCSVARICSVRPLERRRSSFSASVAGALGRHQALVHAGVEAADVAQRPGDVGVARLPVGGAVERGEPADLARRAAR